MTTLPLPPFGDLSDDGIEWTGPKPDDWVILDGDHRAKAGDVVTLDADLARALWAITCRREGR